MAKTFDNIDSFTYFENKVIVDGRDEIISTECPAMTNDGSQPLKAVLFTKGAPLFEETDEGLNEVEQSVYQYALDEYNAVIQAQEDYQNSSEGIAARELSEWKGDRAVTMHQMTVSYNGNTYQADELSQDRMARYITALTDDTTTVNWLDQANTEVALTKVDLKAILLLCVNKQNEVWNLNRP